MTEYERPQLFAMHAEYKRKLERDKAIFAAGVQISTRLGLMVSDTEEMYTLLAGLWDSGYQQCFQQVLEERLLEDVQPDDITPGDL